MKREVEWWEWIYNKETRKQEKIYRGIATFHQFGVDCVESDFGIGSFSTAIIELGDGTVENVNVQDIKFINNVAYKKQLYGMVEWINNRPILNGMKYFEKREQAFECVGELEKMNRINELNLKKECIRVNYTVIDLEPWGD